MTMASKFEVIAAKNLLPVIRAYTNAWRFVHSPYDPRKEAERLVVSWKVDTETIAIYGLGCGYHVQAVLSSHPGLKTVFVIEPYAEVTALARECSDVLADSRVVLLGAANEAELNSHFAHVGDTPLFLHPPSVEICPYPKVTSLLKEMQLLTQTVQRGVPLLRKNWQANATLFNRDTVYSGKQGLYAGQPGVLIAAGPSLGPHLTWLGSDAARPMVKLSVSATLARLLERGIQPTGAIMSDGGEIVTTHIANLPDSAVFPPLYMLSTSHPAVIAKYKGPVHWLLQRGFEPAETLAQKLACDLFETGGSVATSALSLLYYWGCDPIIFVGQDLAYVDGKAYTDGTHHDFLPRQVDEYGQTTVSSVYGTPIHTTPTWNSFRHWIERFIRRYPDRTYINMSHGAHIDGTVHRVSAEL